MRIAVQHVPVTVAASRVEVTIHGELDMATAAELWAALQAELVAVPSRLLVDLTHVVFCSAAGLEVFHRAHQLAAELRVPLCFCSPSRAVRRVAHAAGFGNNLDQPSTPGADLDLAARQAELRAQRGTFTPVVDVAPNPPICPRPEHVPDTTPPQPAQAGRSETTVPETHPGGNADHTNAV